MFIPDPDPDFFSIPDPGVKKAPDPGSGFATLLSGKAYCGLTNTGGPIGRKGSFQNPQHCF
jgi:hypothetical protein